MDGWTHESRMDDLRIDCDGFRRRAEAAEARLRLADKLADACRIQLDRMMEVRLAEGFTSWPVSTQAVADALAAYRNTSGEEASG